MTMRSPAFRPPVTIQRSFCTAPSSTGCCADPLFGVEQQHLGDAGAVALDGPLRHADALLVDRLLQAYAHETAGQQVEVRVGELAAQDDLAGARVDGDVAEQQLARQRIEAAVILNQRGLGLVLADLLQLAGAEGAAQFVEFAGRLGEVGMNRVQLLNQRQRRGFVLPDQRAFGDQARDRYARKSAR